MLRWLSYRCASVLKIKKNTDLKKLYSSVLNTKQSIITTSGKEWQIEILLNFPQHNSTIYRNTVCHLHYICPNISIHHLQQSCRLCVLFQVKTFVVSCFSCFCSRVMYFLFYVANVSVHIVLQHVYVHFAWLKEHRLTNTVLLSGLQTYFNSCN